jgi:ABC-type multidrug transport system fused ATPase/permease subunit
MGKTSGKYKFIKDIFACTDIKYNTALVLYSVTSLAGSFIIGQSIKLILNSIQENTFDFFINYLWISLAFLAALMPVSYFTRFFVLKSAEYVGERFFINLFRHITGLPAVYFDRHEKGDLQSRMTFDIQRSSRIFKLDLDYISKLLFNGFGCLILIFIIKWEIGLLAVLCGILGYLINIRFLQPVQKISREISARTGNMTDIFSQIFRGSSTIRVLNLHQWMENKFDTKNSEMKKSGLKLNGIGALQCLINEIIANINTFLFLVISLAFLSGGGLLFGDVMAAFFYSMAVVNVFTDLSLAFSNLQNSYASIIRINEIQSLAVERDKGSVNSPSPNPDVIRFDHVVFSYDGQKPVLNGTTFQVKEKEILLIKGQSGAGKSTIFKLLLGLYDFTDGGISIYGKDIRTIPLRELRETFSYIPQAPVFFRGTIFENIAAAKENAAFEEVVLAARKANIHDFIDSLPAKYHTDMGDEGRMLSGGQRQSIAIARAILKDASVLLMDEPFSMVDNLNTEVFYTITYNLLMEKTILLISHKSDEALLNRKFGNRIKTLRL